MSTRLLDRLHIPDRSRLRTTPGIAASSVTACVVVFAAAGSKSPGTAFAGLLVISPLVWWVWWLILGMLRAIGDELVRGVSPR